MKKSLKVMLLTTGLFLGALTSNASANLVADGQFNTPYGGGSYTTYSNGSSFGPWNVTASSVDLIGGLWQEPGVGQGSVDMDGNTPGGAITQSLATGVGNYLLTFSLSGNYGGGNPLKQLGVTVGNIISQVFTYNTSTEANNSSNMNYITESLLFHATGATNLVFASLSNNDNGCCWGPVIGNVSVNAVSSVPLPAGLPMFGAALLAMFGFHSFRKRQQLA